MFVSAIGVKNAGFPQFLADPSIRNVASPLTEEMLTPLDPRCRWVQFNSRLTDADFAVLGQWIAQYQSVTLRAYGSYDHSITDLDFLRHFPTVTRFSADTLHNSLQSFDGLGFLPKDVVDLTLGQTKKRLSLAILDRFTDLRRLYLEGAHRDLDMIANLTTLRSLTLHSITMPDLALLLPLERLRALDIKLGGTTQLNLLPEIGAIEYLELWMIRGLNDISAITDMQHLTFLYLESLKNVTRLPDLSHLGQLDTVWLETMRGLADLAPLATAKGLRRLAVVNMPHLQPSAFTPLAGSPTLEEFIPDLGSNKKNSAVLKLVDLPRGDRWMKRVTRQQDFE